MNHEKFFHQAIEKMFQLAGHDMTFDEVVELAKENPRWYTTYTWTREQEKSFSEWFRAHAKTKRWNKTKTQLELDMFLFTYGLKTV